MGFKIIGSSDPKYLAAADILIGDMSNINYEFLIFNRPIILLANRWVRKHFPDIGIKTYEKGLKNSILNSIENPKAYEERRKYWLSKTIYQPPNGSSYKFVEIMLNRSGFNKPKFILLDGNNSVRRTNLIPIYEELKNRNIEVEYHHKLNNTKSGYPETIFIGAHFIDLKNIEYGYRVHIDHDLKGIASANLCQAMKDYRKNDYFPNIDLHITAGLSGMLRTKYLLSTNSDRVIIGGYPKTDDLMKLNANSSKTKVFNDLGFNISKPLVVYAPAGTKKFMKPGGSYNKKVVKKLKLIAHEEGINILVKTKYNIHNCFKNKFIRSVKYIYDIYRQIFFSYCGKEWDKIKKYIEESK